MVVVGVHAAKFPNEKETVNLQNAVRRFDLGHPVINDVDMAVARAYNFRAWPTLWFVDPEGKLIGKHEGELDYASFENLMGRMVAEFDAKGLLKAVTAARIAGPGTRRQPFLPRQNPGRCRL